MDMTPVTLVPFPYSVPHKGTGLGRFISSSWILTTCTSSGLHWGSHLRHGLTHGKQGGDT